MIRSLLYVSTSTLIVPDELPRVDAIVAVSQARNQSLGVTGALIFTERNFVQLLEGDPEAVETLMASIRRDERHTAIEIVQDQRHERRFGGWSMAYSGPASFVRQAVDPLLEDDGPRPEVALRLVRLMEAFAR